jgi:hypothetical protein
MVFDGSCSHCDGSEYVTCPECSGDDDDVVFGGHCPTCQGEGSLPCFSCQWEEYREAIRASQERGGYFDPLVERG